MSENVKKIIQTADPEPFVLPYGEIYRAPLSDGTWRVSLLRLGKNDKRYWRYDEKGAMVWEAYPEAINLPEGTSVVGMLRCPILGEVILPPSVRELDGLAFGIEFYGTDTYQWYALHTVHFSQGLERIGYRAFYNCRDLDGVRLPKGLKVIEKEAFRICLSLSRVTLPESVEEIGSGAFAKCPSLREVIFRGDTCALGGSVFEKDEGLEKVILPKGLERIPYRFLAGCTALEEIGLPKGLSELGGGAFEGCTALKSLRFERDLENIDEIHRESPLAGCTALTGITLGAATLRGDWIPAAPSLTEIRVDRENKQLASVDGVLYSRDKKTLLRVPGGRVGAFAVARGTREIAPFAFSGCSGITEVKLPSTLTCIGEAAFSGCNSLEKIVLPGGLRRLGARAFGDCKALSELNIPAGLTDIGADALNGCTSLVGISVSPENKCYRAEGARLVKLG